MGSNNFVRIKPPVGGPKNKPEKEPEPEYLPTPEEIEEGCRKIRAGWDDETEMERRVDAYRVRAVRLAEVCSARRVSRNCH